VNNASDTQGTSYINVYNGDPNALLYYDPAPSINNHYFHVKDTIAGVLAACTDCHSISKLANQHFTGLSLGSRPLSPGFALKATGGTDTKITYTYDSTPSATPIPRGSCTTDPTGTGCHNGETRFWFNR
jgi:hypothetical protein